MCVVWCMSCVVCCVSSGASGSQLVVCRWSVLFGVVLRVACLSLFAVGGVLIGV